MTAVIAMGSFYSELNHMLSLVATFRKLRDAFTSGALDDQTPDDQSVDLSMKSETFKYDDLKS